MVVCAVPIYMEEFSRATNPIVQDEQGNSPTLLFGQPKPGQEFRLAYLCRRMTGLGGEKENLSLVAQKM
jgi:hypothetical protein